MHDQEKTDILTAFAIGAVVGVGAALLARGNKAARHERLLREIRPLRKTIGREVRTARKAVGRHAHDAAEAGSSYAAEAGRVAADILRDTLGQLVHEATLQVRRNARRSVREAQRALKRVRN